VKTDRKSYLDYDILELQKYDILAVTRQLVEEQGNKRRLIDCTGKIVTEYYVK